MKAIKNVLDAFGDFAPSGPFASGDITAQGSHDATFRRKITAESRQHLRGNCFDRVQSILCAELLICLLVLVETKGASLGDEIPLGNELLVEPAVSQTGLVHQIGDADSRKAAFAKPAGCQPQNPRPVLAGLLSGYFDWSQKKFDSKDDERTSSILL